ncbi:MAG: SPOR domain-containing protein [Bacteroidetes bacterium]|nr:SPOR domain-containing protein [Bacteroidota bacterium]
MKKIILPVFLLIASFSTVMAQGQVNEKLDPNVAALMKRFVETNKSTKTINGWRIQILATTDRQRMEDALRQFGSLYPNIPADWVHNKPYYKLRAGAYVSKRDALATLYVLKNDYPTAYPIQDSEIKPEELIKQ